MLNEFISEHRDEIIHRCRAKVAARPTPLTTNTSVEIEHGVPLLLAQLVDALRLGQVSSPAIDSSAGQHGHDLLLHGFNISAVVHGYGDVCQSITELAVETHAPISADEFRILNGCLDGAIATAVTEYSCDVGPAIDDSASVLHDEPLEIAVHELRNLIRYASVAFEAIRSGRVGVGGSTGTVLHQSLSAAGSLVDRFLDDARFTPAVRKRM
jgi:hypothetical protein